MGLQKLDKQFLNCYVQIMFAQKIINGFRKDKRRVRRVDLVTEQVRSVLKTADQKLILMVRSQKKGKCEADGRTFLFLKVVL